MKLQAGALIFALFIMVISVVMIGILLATGIFYHNRQLNYINQQRFESYTQSAINVVLNDSTLSFPWETNLPILDSSNSYVLNAEKMEYGAYQKFVINATYNNYTKKQAFLAGTNGENPSATAIFLPYNSYELCISGNTMISGNCYLGKSGIRASYVMGDYYRNKELVNGSIYTSKSKLPTINQQWISNMDALVDGSKTMSDSTLEITKTQQTRFSNSFFNKTLVLYAKSSVYLNQCQLNGNIVVVSSDSICVYKGAVLDQVILMARKIKIAEGVEANCQLIASDTIIIEKDVKLNFHSVLVTLSRKNKGLIRLSEGDVIEGNIIMVSRETEQYNKNICKMPVNCTLRGIAHIEGTFDFMGTVTGTVETNLFTLHTPSGYYENYLYNSVIDAKALSDQYVSADVYSMGRYKIITEVK